ncbi:PREDICTED: trihelix transcription factor GT-3b-like [Ipomoea nil]|uniref:trihelix transcription factor GT-3b-like n=1 Tax=Ipomoea nil TaxID=35883 RepID=UPI000901C5AE|nr:PREDICTED: trihelix transcription factor GT-3b-like [Ipomoea nil]
MAQEEMRQQFPLYDDLPADVAGNFREWNIQESRDMLVVRAGLEPAFIEPEIPNNRLWEIIANEMKKKGYNRTVEQCKLLWKTLVLSYKACRKMERVEMRRQQFVFYDEVHAIFDMRMDYILYWEAEDASGTSSQKRFRALLSDNDKVSAGGEVSKKRKTGNKNNSESSENLENSSKEINVEVMKKQREEERRVREMEWQNMRRREEGERDGVAKYDGDKVDNGDGGAKES